MASCGWGRCLIRGRRRWNCLRLSNAQIERLRALPEDDHLAPELNEHERRAELYRREAAGYRDAVRYRWALSGIAAQCDEWSALLQLADDWPVPVFPVTGKDLIGLGMTPGRKMGDALRELENWWIAAGFPDSKAAVLAQIDK